jgi:hypothetical protein
MDKHATAINTVSAVALTGAHNVLELGASAAQLIATPSNLSQTGMFSFNGNSTAAFSSNQEQSANFKSNSIELSKK